MEEYEKYLVERIAELEEERDKFYSTYFREEYDFKLEELQKALDYYRQLNK